MIALIIASCLAVASARPSYIAVPADQIAFLDLSRMHVRVPRQTLVPPQLPQALYDEDYQPLPLQQYQHQQQGIAGLVPPPEPQHRSLPLQQQHEQQEEIPVSSHDSSARLNERPPDFGEYVDFGAHTGDNGAFGWYADYPINNHDGSSYRK